MGATVTPEGGRRVLRIEHAEHGHGPYRTAHSSDESLRWLSRMLTSAHNHDETHPGERLDVGDVAYALVRQGEAYAALVQRLGDVKADQQRTSWSVPHRFGKLARPLTFEQSCLETKAHYTLCAFSDEAQLLAWFTADQLQQIAQAGYHLVEVQLHAGATMADGAHQVMYRQADEASRAVLDWAAVLPATLAA